MWMCLLGYNTGRWVVWCGVVVMWLWCGCDVVVVVVWCGVVVMWLWCGVVVVWCGVV